MGGGISARDDAWTVGCQIERPLRTARVLRDLVNHAAFTTKPADFPKGAEGLAHTCEHLHGRTRARES